MSAWLVVMAAGLGSYLFRISMVVLVDRRSTSTRFAHVSTLVPLPIRGGLVLRAMVLPRDT